MAEPTLYPAFSNHPFDVLFLAVRIRLGYMWDGTLTATDEDYPEMWNTELPDSTTLYVEWGREGDEFDVISQVRPLILLRRNPSVAHVSASQPLGHVVSNTVHAWNYPIQVLDRSVVVTKVRNGNHVATLLDVVQMRQFSMQELSLFAHHLDLEVIFNTKRCSLSYNSNKRFTSPMHGIAPMSSGP